LYKVNYLDKYKRKNVAVKNVLFYLDTYKNYKVSDRFFLLFSDILFNFKSSTIYKRKLIIYKKVFRL
jgi:hypothetical protein